MIPNWTDKGIIPPINYLSPTSIERSPYQVSLTDVILKYGTSPKRNQILLGLLNFRRELHKIGITKGFQWIDGSFLEDIETLECRPPNDIDVVNFYYIPEGLSQKELVLRNSKIFDPILVKENFKVDGYFISISLASPERLISRTAYWYSMWSHKRDESWKGFLQIDLSPSDDEAARTNLNTNLGMVEEESK
jgi:hypothetical protein